MSGSPTPEPPGRPLNAVLEAELESVLQSVFAARQDVLEARREPRFLATAERTLQGCVATLQILLGLLRAAPGRHGGWQVSLDRMSEAFCVLRVDGTLLHMNAAVTRLVGRDHRALVDTTFEQRPWTDRAQMRAHLDRAHATGRAQETFALERGDGQVVDLTFRTERIDVDGGESFLLMSHVRPDEAQDR